MTRGNEIPTIDVALITVTVGESEIGLNTASKLGVNTQVETKDAVKLVVKGVLIAQKPSTVTITGHTLVLTDNVFNPELVKMLQGGTIKYWQNEGQTTEGTEDKGFGVSSYTPPVVGTKVNLTPFILKAYSAIYDEGGIIQGYECTSYPNCKGQPVAMNSEDDVFRVPEYTIDSAPSKGQAPYEIHYVKTLPVLGVSV